MSLRMECKFYEGTCLVLTTSSHLCENLRLVLASVLTCDELKTAKHWSLHPSTHVSFLLKAKQFKRRNVHYQKFPSLGYHGLKFSKEESAQVFMLSKALGHELYRVQTCAWLHLRWALPYSSKANCLRLYHTWPFTKLQAKRPAIYGKTPLTCTRDKRKNC